MTAGPRPIALTDATPQACLDIARPEICQIGPTHLAPKEPHSRVPLHRWDSGQPRSLVNYVHENAS
jgi:hypothetical protein